MDNNLFLKKFSKSSELVGREGPLGILNNLHTNIKGFKPQKIKKIKEPKKPEPDYSYVSSIVKEDFNQNKNFIPQLNVLLNPMKFKNNQIYNSIVKNYVIKKNESKNNFVKKTNELDNDIVFKKIQNQQKNKVMLKYINTNKKPEQHFNHNNESNIFNNNSERKKRLFLNNNSNFNHNSKELLPLIPNHSQHITSSSEILRRNFTNKKSFTPILRRPFRLLNKNNSQKINLENSNILKKSNSTMNIRVQNNSNNNIFSNLNKNSYINMNENFNNKSSNFRNKNDNKFRYEIDENKKHIINQVILNKKGKKRKRDVKEEINHINNDNRFNSYSYQNDVINNLNYIKSNELQY